MTMLDITMPGTDASWQKIPTEGDVVLFRFPSEGASVGATPVARPSLVLELGNLAGTRFALLAFGCTARTNKMRGYEIRVLEPDEILAAGLRAPSRFLIRQMIVVPLDDTGFVADEASGTPIIGHLEGAAHQQFSELRERMQAGPGSFVGASPPQEGRRSRRRSTARPFLVERKRRKRRRRASGVSA